MKRILDFISKKKIKSFLSFSLCCFILLFSLFCSHIFGINKVSAASNIHVIQDNFSIAEFNNPQNIDIDFLRQLDDAIYLNSSIRSANVDKSNSFWVLAENTGTYYLQILKLSPRVECGSYTLPYTFTSIVSFNTVDFISSYSFSFSNMTTSSRNTNNHTETRFYQDGRIPVIGTFDWKGSADSGVTVSNFTVRYADVAVVRNYNFPFDPILSPILDYPYNLDIQSQSFTEWLISSEKYLEIYHSLQANHVSGFVDVFRQYGGSSSFFKKYCKGFFDFNNIGQGVSDYNLILKKTKALYQEYLLLKNDTVGNHLLPRVESSIIPETNDNNLTLVTNQNTDDDSVKVLRDILRSLIALPSTLNDFNNLILNAINSLDLTTNIVNDGGAGLTSSDIWGSGSITDSENYLALTAAFMDKGVDVSAAENMQINYLENANQADSFTVSVVMPDQYVNGQFTEKTVTHTIDNTSKMYNTLILFRKLIAFAVVAYFAIRIRFELPHLIRGE